MLLEEGGQVAGAKPAYASFTSQMLRLVVNYSSRWHIIYDRLRYQDSNALTQLIPQTFLYGPDTSTGASIDTEGNVIYLLLYSLILNQLHYSADRLAIGLSDPSLEGIYFTFTYVIAQIYSESLKRYYYADTYQKCVPTFKHHLNVVIWHYYLM